MTAWELITMLQEDGWSVDQAKSSSKLEPFSVHRNTPKLIWLNEKNQELSRPYLLCLALRSSLKPHGVQNILHLQSKTYYNEILEAAGLQKHRGRRKLDRRGALELDDAGMVHKAAAPSKLAGLWNSRVGAKVGARTGTVAAAAGTKKKKAKTTRGSNELSYMWGPHRMTFKSPSSWFAVCCRKASHAKPDKPTTRCTRTTSFKGPPGGEDDLRAQRMLKMWLNLCQDQGNHQPLL